jgi:hypothetical protein
MLTGDLPATAKKIVDSGDFQMANRGEKRIPHANPPFYANFSACDCMKTGVLQSR